MAKPPRGITLNQDEKRAHSKVPATYRRSLRGVAHAHGCKRCGLRYEDNCQKTTRDGLCTPCKTQGARDQPWWPAARCWVPFCCKGRIRALNAGSARDRVILKAHALAGARQWYICEACGRTNTYRLSDPEPPFTAKAWRAHNQNMEME